MHLRTLAAFLVLLPASGFGADCVTAIGEWDWFTGGRVIVEGNQILKYNGFPLGRWECTTPSQNVLTLHWTTGFTDTVTVSPDGRSIAGKNTAGARISATRVGASPASAARAAAPTAQPVTPQAPAAQFVVPQMTKPKEFHYDATTDDLFEKGFRIYNAKNVAGALPYLQQAAERGHARAQALLGIMYRSGDGVPRNLQTAAVWFEKAAAQGHRAAAYHLGNMYDVGDGLAVNKVLAVKYYDISARQNFYEAQFELAFNYEFGQGAPRNRQMAIFWLTQAQRQGDGLAGWVVSFLKNPRTPHFQTPVQLRNYISQQVSAWVARITPLGGSSSSSGGGSSSSSVGGGGGGGGCGSYTDYGACNAHKAGNDWAADRLERHESPPSEHDWYNH